MDDLPPSAESTTVRDGRQREGEAARLSAELEQERRSRMQAEEAARRLAAAVAAEHQGRRRAEEAAEHALHQLELFRAHRDLNLHGARKGRRRHLWRRVLRAWRA